MSEDFEKRIFQAIKELKTEVHDINRGLYGDPKNGVPGLIAEQKEDRRIMSDHQTRIEELEEDKTRRNWMIAKVSGAFGFLIALWEAFKSLK